MKTTAAHTLVLSLALLIAGCASTSSPKRSSDNPNRITREEIHEAPSYADAYHLIRKLRPFWLRKRGAQSFSDAGAIDVYVNGQHYRGVQALHSINPLNVKSITFLGASDATVRYGTGHSYGAIVIKRRVQ